MIKEAKNKMVGKSKNKKVETPKKVETMICNICGKSDLKTIEELGIHKLRAHRIPLPKEIK